MRFPDDLRAAWSRGPVAFFGHFKAHAGWALLIALLNLVGIAYGFYYYRAQFGPTPLAFRLFVPDSPLAVLWAQLALLAAWAAPHLHARSAWGASLDALAFVGNVQVGLWTVYVLLAYAPAFGTFDAAHPSGPLNTVLLFGHAGMALLGFVFLQGMRQRWHAHRKAMAAGLGVAAAYYLVNDLLDYWGPDFLGSGCGMRPYTVPCPHPGEGALALVTLALSLASLLALWLAIRRPIPGRRALP